MKTPNPTRRRQRGIVYGSPTLIPKGTLACALQIALLLWIAPSLFAGPADNINFVGSSTPSTYAVTTTSGIALAANINRKDTVIVNDGATKCYLSRSSTAVAGRGITLYPSGGSYNIDQNNLYKGDISAVTASGATTLSISEGK